MAPPKFPHLPFWSALAAGGALVLGLALAHDHRARGGDRAPQVNLTRLDGKQQQLAANTVTLVDFWATWCAPCRASMPRVERIYRDYTPRGMALLSVDTDAENPDRDPTVREFLMQNALDFPVSFDNGPAQDAFHVSALPTMMVVGKDGAIAWRHTGALDAGEERELRRILDDALAQK